MSRCTFTRDVKKSIKYTRIKCIFHPSNIFIFLYKLHISVMVQIMLDFYGYSNFHVAKAFIGKQKKLQHISNNVTT